MYVCSKTARHIGIIMQVDTYIPTRTNTLHTYQYTVCIQRCQFLVFSVVDLNCVVSANQRVILIGEFRLVKLPPTNGSCWRIRKSSLKIDQRLSHQHGIGGNDGRYTYVSAPIHFLCPCADKAVKDTLQHSL